MKGFDKAGVHRSEQIMAFVLVKIGELEATGVVEDMKINGFGAGSLIAALSVVPAGMQVPDATLAAGAPARVRKTLEGESAAWVKESAAHYVELSRAYLNRDPGHDG